MSLTANSSGEIAGKFTIPANIPSGSKLVQFIGEDTTAAATFVGRGVLKTEELRLVNTVVNRRVLTWSGDPLAQTFVLDRRRQVAAIDLWFQAKGPSKVLVQIREVDLGIPNAEVVAESILQPSQITLSGPTRFKFPPVVLEAGREYAIVAACDDAQAALWVGELGKFDAFVNKWVTSQPYQIGVLLSSSNNRTWTAHQEKDLTFRLIAADYNVVTNSHNEGETTKEVPLTSVAVTNADQLLIMAAVDRPSENTDVTFLVTVSGVEYTMIEGQPLSLPERFTGTITWRAVLHGTYEESPSLLPDVHLIAGTRRSSGTYITRAIQAGVNSKVTVYYDAFTPGTSAVAVHAESGVDTWTSVPVVDGTELGDGWEEVKHELADFDGDDTRIRLTLTGTEQQRPIVRNLRVLIT